MSKKFYATFYAIVAKTTKMKLAVLGNILKEILFIINYETRKSRSNIKKKKKNSQLITINEVQMINSKENIEKKFKQSVHTLKLIDPISLLSIKIKDHTKTSMDPENKSQMKS